jgi:sugar fermentation stimulation protein A
MNFKTPLVEGLFLKRYKRFFADVIVDGTTVTAHVPNTGSLKTCLEENAPCYLTHNPDPARKLKWTLERLKINSQLIGVNTGLPNPLVYEAWQSKILSHWSGYDQAQKEVKINQNSRLDMVFWNKKDFPDLKKINPEFIENFKKTSETKNKIHFIEIKNVTMSDGDTALFPDAVTSRGAKHIEEFVQLIEKGFSAELVFVIQREGLKKFKVAEEIDPTYAKALEQAQAKGLKVTALKVKFSDHETKIIGTL